MPQFRTWKAKLAQFTMILMGIGCGVFAGVYWFVTGDEKECPWWAKIIGIVVVLMAAVGFVMISKWYVYN